MASYQNASDSRPLLTDLPKDALILVFGYCDFETLLNLAQVCRRFNALASQDILWRPVLKKCVNGPHLKRSNALTLKDYCRLSFNWVRGQYLEKPLVDFHTKLLPWLQLSKTSLFVSKENEIKIFNHHRRNRKLSVPVCSINCGAADVTRFVTKNDMIVSGGMGKALVMWNIKGNSYHEVVTFLGHTMPVYCVDILDEIVLSGSRDRSIKIWSLSGECVNTISVGDSVRSIAVNAYNRTFVAGSAGYLTGRSPLRLYDCETGRELYDLICESTQRRGAGVVDLKYDSANVLLSCGYDTAVRLWDMRNNSRCCVKKWEDPHDSTVYCIDSDKKWMILSGTSRYGVVRMWDKRMDRSVKYYNVSRHSTSPVYSLRFNQTKLFVALDNRVNVLNFESR